jgi:amidase
MDVVRLARTTSLPVPRVAHQEGSAALLTQAMASRRLSAERLLHDYRARINALDRHGPRLNSVIELNPDALATARALDTERMAGLVRSPLHGLSILIKDNIATGDRMSTSAGSMALDGVRANRDAHVVKRLREAGAVILGKTNMSEWANFRSTRSVSGWSARGGMTRNPYALDRSPGGSSSGTAVAIAAGLAALGVGTETDGSIVSPAAINGLVALKPTVGRISRNGVIPIAPSQDTVGPMAGSVADAALLYGVMAGIDPADPATALAPFASAGDGELNSDALRGARLGVARAYFTGYGEADALIERAITQLQALGAEIVDPVDLAPVNYRPAERLVLLYEFKAALADWLAEFAPQAPVQCLADVIAYNTNHAAQEMPHFAQELFHAAQVCGDLRSADYLAALAECRLGARDNGLDRVLRQHQLDAVIAPTRGPAWLVDPIAGDYGGVCFSTPAAVAGYPHLTVPAGQVRGLPIGLSFVGPAWSEWHLLSMGLAFEQETQLRRAPSYLARSVPF